MFLVTYKIGNVFRYKKPNTTWWDHLCWFWWWMNDNLDKQTNWSITTFILFSRKNFPISIILQKVSLSNSWIQQKKWIKTLKIYRKSFLKKLWLSRDRYFFSINISRFIITIIFMIGIPNKLFFTSENYYSQSFLFSYHHHRYYHLDCKNHSEFAC